MERGLTHLAGGRRRDARRRGGTAVGGAHPSPLASRRGAAGRAGGGGSGTRVSEWSGDAGGGGHGTVRQGRQWWTHAHARRHAAAKAGAARRVAAVAKSEDCPWPLLTLQCSLSPRVCVCRPRAVLAGLKKARGGRPGLCTCTEVEGVARETCCCTGLPAPAAASACASAAVARRPVAVRGSRSRDGDCACECLGSFVHMGMTPFTRSLTQGLQNWKCLFHFKLENPKFFKISRHVES